MLLEDSAGHCSSRRALFSSGSGQLWIARDTSPSVFRWTPAAAQGGARLLRNPSICGRIRELQEAVSADVISLEITARNSRVKALQKRWDRLRAGLDLLLQHRGADMADLRGGASGMLLPRLQWEGSRPGRLPDRSRGVAVASKIRVHERQATEELG
jgi:hypothetical protein